MMAWDVLYSKHEILCGFDVGVAGGPGGRVCED